LIVFALDAKGVELPPAPPSTKIPPPPQDKQPREAVLAGAELYSQNCRTCHGANAAGGVVDLRYLTAGQHAGFMDTVLKGTHKAKGMASFRDLLSDEQAQQIHSYLINRAQEDWQPNFGPPPKQR
jgi:quinohemoprotein ethanol dehydrogenase